ncbi:MAG: hypothetical protein AAF531_22410 [Actinomycetota bacterium]
MDQSSAASWQAPVPVLEFCASRQAAIDRVLERLIDPGHGLSTIAVFGGRGLGKSRAIQATGAGALARGMAVVQLKTGEAHQAPFATILSGFPTLEPLLFDEPDGRTWDQAIAAIERERTDVGLLILIDDAHDVDSESARFLAFLHRRLIREKNAGPFVAVAMAVPEVDLLPDRLIRRLIKAQRTSFVELEPLHQAELADLVGMVFTDASAPIRRALTVDLMKRSEGHPSVIDALIPLVDRSTYTIDLGPAPAPGAVASVIEDANRSVGDGAFRNAVEKLSSLNHVPGLQLNEATRTLLATSLYRIGAYAEADRVTGELVDEVLAAGDHETAFSVATLGLPEAEQHDGSAVRLGWLLRIEPDLLAEESRCRHATLTARQLVLGGDATDAEGWWRTAERLAITADERATTASVGWYVVNHRVQPDHQVETLQGLLSDTGLSPDRKLSLQEHLCISLYEAGRIAESESTLRKIGRYAAAAGDDLRDWHHRGFLGVLAFEDGRWEDAERHRIEAVAHAQDRAISEGETLYLAQKFNESFIKNDHAVFASMSQKLPPDLAGSWFGRLAGVEAFRAAGRIDEVRDVGQELVRQSIDEPGYRTPTSLAYLSRFIDETATDEDREAILGLLGLRAGSLLVHGFGAASLGPADRYLFHISGDITHLERAIEVADAAGIRLWRVLLRAEYAAAAGGGRQLMRRQAEGLAEGTDLGPLLDLWG